MKTRSTLMTAGLLLAVAATSITPASAQEAQAVRDALTRAQSGAERRAVEDLLNRLRGTQAAAQSAAATPAVPIAPGPSLPTLPATPAVLTSAPASTASAPAGLAVPSVPPQGSAPIRTAAVTPPALTLPAPAPGPAVAQRAFSPVTNNVPSKPVPILVAGPAVPASTATLPTIAVRPTPSPSERAVDAAPTQAGPVLQQVRQLTPQRAQSSAIEVRGRPAEICVDGQRMPSRSGGFARGGR